MESALLIIAPKPVQAFAYPLREEYDPKSFAKVPAHITLFYPFVPPALAEEEGGKLESICSKISPFEITLDRYTKLDDAVARNQKLSRKELYDSFRNPNNEWCVRPEVTISLS